MKRAGIRVEKGFFFKKNSRKVCRFRKKHYLCTALSEMLLAKGLNAEIAQLVEHNLAKVGVAGSSPVFRSMY